jgi:hypothetical protein
LIDGRFVPLLDAIRQHLAAFELSGGIYEVKVTRTDVWVLLCAQHHPAGVVAELLDRAKTLAALRVTALRWQTDGTYDLQLTVHEIGAEQEIPIETPLVAGSEGTDLVVVESGIVFGLREARSAGSVIERGASAPTRSPGDPG